MSTVADICTAADASPSSLVPGVDADGDAQSFVSAEETVVAVSVDAPTTAKTPAPSPRSSTIIKSLSSGAYADTLNAMLQRQLAVTSSSRTIAICDMPPSPPLSMKSRPPGSPVLDKAATTHEELGPFQRRQQHQQLNNEQRRTQPSKQFPTIHPVAYENCAQRFQHLHQMLHAHLAPTMAQLRQFYTHFLNPIIGDAARYGLATGGEGGVAATDGDDADLYLLCTRAKNMILALVALWRRLCDALMMQTELSGSYSGTVSANAGEVAFVRTLRAEILGDAAVFEAVDMFMRRYERMMSVLAKLLAADIPGNVSSPADSAKKRWTAQWRQVEAMPFCRGLGLTAMYLLPLQAWLQLEEGLTRVWNAMPATHPDHQTLEQLLCRTNKLLQPLRTDIVWQKRLRFLAVQKAIRRCMTPEEIEGGGGSNSVVVADSCCSVTDMATLCGAGSGSAAQVVPILLTPTRELLEEGHMYKVHRHTGGASAFVKVLLFNDCFVYATDTLSQDRPDRFYTGATETARRRVSFLASPGAMLESRSGGRADEDGERFTVRRVLPLMDCWLASGIPSVGESGELPVSSDMAILASEAMNNNNRRGAKATSGGVNSVAAITFSLVQVFDTTPAVPEGVTGDTSKASAPPLERSIFLCRTANDKYEWTVWLRDAIEQLAAKHASTFQRRQALLEGLRDATLNGTSNEDTKSTTNSSDGAADTEAGGDNSDIGDTEEEKKSTDGKKSGGVFGWLRARLAGKQRAEYALDFADARADDAIMRWRQIA